MNEYGSVLVKWKYTQSRTENNTWVQSKLLERTVPIDATLKIYDSEPFDDPPPTQTPLDPPTTVVASSEKEKIRTNKLIYEGISFIWGCGGTMAEFETINGTLSEETKDQITTSVDRIGNYLVGGRRRLLFPSQREKPHIAAFVGIIKGHFTTVRERLEHIPLLFIIFHFILSCSACNHNGKFPIPPCIFCHPLPTVQFQA